MNRFQPSFLAMAVATLSVATSAHAAAQDVHQFDVQGQSAETGIPLFAHQAQIQILVPQSMVANLKVNSVHGSLPTGVALSQLLRGTNLVPSAVAGGAIILRPTAAAKPVSVSKRPVALTMVSQLPVDSGAASLTQSGDTTAPKADAPAVPDKDIIVTGSRTIKNGNNSPTPVTVVAVDQLLDSHPGSISDAINDLPIFSGSRGQNGNPGTGVTNNSGNVQNLRALGYTRTLVLWDGHRLPPTTQDGLVDTDMIPQLLLKRVDIVTGGASAVYGSDAISGVVNFITDTTFKGLKLQAIRGVSTYGDDATTDLGIAYGRPFAEGRGHFEVSYQYRNDPGVLSRLDRPWGTHQYTVQGGGTAANPYHLVDNTRISTTTFGGLIRSGPLAGYQFASNGTLSPFVNGAATGTNGYQSGGDGAYYNSSIRAAMRSHQAFARLDYDFTDAIHGYVEGSYTSNHTANYGTYNFVNNITLSATNAYLPAAYQAQTAAGGASSFTYSRMFSDLPRVDTVSQTDQYFINAGLKGNLGSKFKWDASYTNSQVILSTLNDNNINNQKLAAAEDAVTDGNGNVVCRVTLTNPGLYPGCTPINLFGSGNISPAAAAYITQQTGFRAVTKLNDVQGTISGSPVTLWAGPVNVALTGEWRRLSYTATSNASPTDYANCTGLRYNCTSSTLLWADATLANRSTVSQSVSEVAGEIDLPLLHDVALARDVSFNGALRYTYYDTSGSAWTYKAGLDWNVSKAFKLRGSYSRDIRAPNLNDLYQPQTAGTGAFTDLLTGQSPTVAVYTAGNPNLKPEVGKTLSVGGVVKPAFMPGFSMSLDYFKITVSDAITNIQGTNPSIQAACYASGGSSPYCALQTRPINFTNTTAANAVTSFTSTVINIARVRTWGFDYEANYAHALFGHPFSLRALVTWQPHIIYEQPGINTIDVAGVSFSSNSLQASPKWRATVFADYKLGNFQIGVVEKWRSSLAWTGDPTQIFNQPNTPAVAYTNLNLAVNVPLKSGTVAQMFFNIQNLFNKQPPPAAFLGANGNVGAFGGFAYGDDPIGRYFSAGFRVKL
ncbi:TonB-dependent receptor [Novosphingobium terrae]|uniref:TonB-dependent receptor n=1 Tax=Novosphingobium terrae TaxID=2726189 RepID=UPI00197EC8B8|nr:TonB-dependent receptor [Novosphingobium terrae]